MIKGALSELTEQLKNGGTTGDKIADFVMVACGADPKCEQILRDLEARLKGKTGQLVLAVSKTRMPRGCINRGLGGPTSWATNDHWHLGTLAGELLILDPIKGTRCLPTGPHVLFSPGRAFGQEEPLEKLDTDMGIHACALFPQQLSGDEMEILTGDEEVGTWVARNRRISEFRKMLDFLGQHQPAISPAK